MNARQFYSKEDCANNDLYDLTSEKEWIFGETEMIIFAERYYQYRKELEENGSRKEKE